MPRDTPMGMIESPNATTDRAAKSTCPVTTPATKHPIAPRMTNRSRSASRFAAASRAERPKRLVRSTRSARVWPITVVKTAATYSPTMGAT